MIRRIFPAALVLLFAFVILFLSVLRTASVRYSFSAAKPVSLGNADGTESQEVDDMEINYALAYPGTVLPDHPLWVLKAARDKIWLLITTDPARKSELNLLFADKRLGAARVLFEKGKFEIGFSTLTKAEKYLQNACGIETKLRESGVETLELSKRLINASLKHRQVIKQIYLLAPEDAKPKVVEAENYAKTVYSEKSSVLTGEGIPLPENPFNGD